MKKLQDLKVDIFGFVETNLARKPQNVYKARIKTKQRTNGQCKIQTSASDIPPVSDSQPGGTITGIVGRHVGRVLETGADLSEMGRWSWICLNGQRSKLYIVTAYRVAQEQSDGINTVHVQQKTIMSVRGEVTLNPWNQ
eukprot:2846119-Ditylum_brightwellii.AAC.1